jgi:pimeloyl-ACP methyl ester carboxylesterase
MSDYLDLGTGPIHWKDYGGRGRVVVLVHGLGGSIANWDVIGPRLTDRGRVVALDLPGFGLSPPARDWSLTTHRDAIVAFIESFDTPVTLIGNSLGGLLSEMVASHRPDLVSALVLIAPATPPRFPDPRIDWPTAWRLAINSAPVLGPALSRHIIDSMTPRELINDSLQRITYDRGRVPLEMVESFVQLAETRRHFPWAADAIPRTGASIRRLFVHRSRFVEMIRDIKAPTLVVQGVADHIVSPTSVEWMCRLRPDWSLTQMDGTGHTPQIDAPIRLLDVLRPWLDEHMRTEISA